VLDEQKDGAANMDIAEIVNADTVKLTLVPGIIVALVLFFWFRRSGPRITPKARENTRGRADAQRDDPLLDGAGEWEIGAVRVISRDDDRLPRVDLEGDSPLSADVRITERRSPRNPTAARTAERGVRPAEAAHPRGSFADGAGDGVNAANAKNALPEDSPSEPVQGSVSAPAAVVKKTVSSAVRPAISPGNSNADPELAAEQQCAELRANTPTEALTEGRQGERENDTRRAQKELESGLMLVLTVISNGRPLRGSSVLKAVTSAGLTFGKMGIFHYYAPTRPGRRPLFSLANMVEPGSFNLANLDEMSTPGLTLFANVVSAEEGTAAFNAMLDTARKLADMLHCTVCDERRSTLSKQGIEHIHGRIQDFQRRARLSHAANA
jgi:cell division protein ZipA